MHKGHPTEENQQRVSIFFFSEQTYSRNEWENDDSDFFQALYSVHKKFGQFLFHTYFLACLKEDKSAVKSYTKYLNKLVIIKAMALTF